MAASHPAVSDHDGRPQRLSQPDARGSALVRWPSWTDRRGPLAAEVALFAALVVADTVVAVRGGLPHGVGLHRGLAGTIATDLGPGAGPAVALLALLRRRFSDRIALLGGCAVAIALLGMVSDAAAAVGGQRLPLQLDAAETAAVAVLVGAAARRLPVRSAAALAAVGVVMVAGPVLRTGTTRADSLIAVAAALIWGGALAVGLLLRDADARRDAALTELRSAERLRLARDLHDLVAHHITGVVVRVQAARTISAHQPASGEPGPDGTDALFAEIEAAGAEALAAMRRLVRMLRTDPGEQPSTPARIADAVASAIPADDRISTHVPAAVAGLLVKPEVAGTVHRIVMEALTNARHHAPSASQVTVDLRTADQAEGGWLVVEVANDGVPVSPAAERPGYGLVGMAERVTALGGTLYAGPEPGQRWLVSARLPLGPLAPAGAWVPGLPGEQR
jgi:signal transduction histidine kinase